MLQLLVVGYLTVCYFLPNIIGGERNADCTMRTGFANAMFGWCISAPLGVLHLGFIIGFAIKKRSSSNVALLQEYVQRATIVVSIGQVLITLLGYATFFFWNQVLWGDLSSGDNCLAGYNLLDILNWVILIFVTAWAAIIVALGCCIGVCCGPCIFKAY